MNATHSIRETEARSRSASRQAAAQMANVRAFGSVGVSDVLPGCCVANEKAGAALDAGTWDGEEYSEHAQAGDSAHGEAREYPVCIMDAGSWVCTGHRHAYLWE